IRRSPFWTRPVRGTRLRLVLSRLVSPRTFLSGRQEVSFQTSGMGAEVQAGGVRMNMIPKNGGNVLRGGGFAGGTAESWQSNNVDDSLKSLGLVIPNGVQHVQDFNAFVGGPIKENKLWFFGTGRHVSVNEKVANSFYRDGVTPAIVDQCVRD